MEEQHHDDQSHYEISLTAGQAFVAFVLLLLSLAASFAFGLMLGKGQADERLVVQKETPVVSEAALIPKKTEGKIVELGVENDDFMPEETKTDTTSSDAAVIVETTGTAAAEPAPVQATETVAATTPAAPAVPHFAQLLSTTDQKTAETMAAKLIDGGFPTAYVERGAATEKGPVFRVRVKFPSETEARGAEAKLREFSKDVWITTR
jgi:SPOR domain